MTLNKRLHNIGLGWLIEPVTLWYIVRTIANEFSKMAFYAQFHTGGFSAKVVAVRLKVHL